MKEKRRRKLLTNEEIKTKIEEERNSEIEKLLKAEKGENKCATKITTIAEITLTT